VAEFVCDRFFFAGGLAQIDRLQIFEEETELALKLKGIAIFELPA
jgi:hypothetical protein